MDSLIGALDFLSQNPTQRVLFVSHYDSQMRGPKGNQVDLIGELQTIYSGRIAFIPSLRVTLDHTNVARETTFRSRSLLFLGIALVAAQATSTLNIVVPENGTVSLNFPLSPSRRSSCSTRTTHPTVIDAILSIWKLLSINTDVRNPYEFQTKGEMVNGCKDSANLFRLATKSNSCGKRGHRAHWTVPGASHCGFCMPCIYRRASLLNIGDTTTYGNSINSLIPFLSKKSQDVGACLDFLSNPLTKEEIKQELIVNGVKNLSKINQYADVVCRTRQELRNWVNTVGNSTIRSKVGS
ncbi:MAG: hypothetical protein EOP48_25965 [Sphingobacteriales bacterium]|nr:MAG: hypothetical protein EOP48_25965 [Sphingobacteriales bacterium]